MTIYLFTTSQQRCYTIKEIHTFAKEYLQPLSSQVAFCQQFNIRLNWLEGAIQKVVSNLTSDFILEGCDQGILLADSLPILAIVNSPSTH